MAVLGDTSPACHRPPRGLELALCCSNGQPLLMTRTCTASALGQSFGAGRALLCSRGGAQI